MKSTQEAFGNLSHALLRLRRAVFVEFCGPMRQFRLHLLTLAVVYLAGVLAVGAFLAVDPSSMPRLLVACLLGLAWWWALRCWLHRVLL